MEKNKENNHQNPFLAQWLAGEISDTKLKSLVHESDYIAYKKIKAGIDVFSQLEAPMNTSWNAINSKINESKFKINTYFKWVASIAAITVLFFGIKHFTNQTISSYNTSFNQQKNIALLDQSQVILNSKSILSYDAKQWEESRTVTLKGEAFFKVKKGSTFTVKTPNGSVEVLGTQFNVNAFQDYFEVICFEGKVKVTSQGQTYILYPKESYRKINGYASEKLEYLSSSPSWIEGETTFKSVPLKYVLSALENQYQVSFNTSRINKNLIYTGVFTNHNLELALKTVFKPLKIKYLVGKDRKIQLMPNK
ncbi:MAG: FecR family protein [Flavobacteriales bacterium]